MALFLLEQNSLLDFGRRDYCSRDYLLRDSRLLDDLTHKTTCVDSMDYTFSCNATNYRPLFILFLSFLAEKGSHELPERLSA